LIKIERNSKFKDYASLTRFENYKKAGMTIPLEIKKIGENEQVFYNGIIGNPITIGTSYLKRTLKQTPSKTMHKIVSENLDLLGSTQTVKIVTSSELNSNSDEVFSNMGEIASNRDNYKYSINSRGLIEYILGKIEEEEKEHRIRNVEISNTLANLSENYKQEFPFLMNYNGIKDLYDKLASEEGIIEYRYFQVNILKKIALELQYDINRISEKELNYHIINRYSEELTKPFVESMKGWMGFVPNTVRGYFVRNLIWMRDNYLRPKLENIESRIKNMTMYEKQ
jgi:hypothetical protein